MPASLRLPSVGHPKMSLVDLATASSHAIALKKIKATTRQGMFSSFYSSSSGSLYSQLACLAL